MTATDIRRHTFRKGWEQPVSADHARLTHAAEPDRVVSLCGLALRVFGEAWAEPSRTHPECRCAICSQAVSLTAMGDRMG